MRRVSRGVVVALSALLTACGGRLLHADFDSDPIGSPPAELPPGDPPGDRIHINLPDADSPITVVPGLDGTGGALQFSRIGLERGWGHLMFLPDEAPADAEEFWVAWNGRIELPDGTAGLLVWFGDALPHAELRFESGDIHARSTTDVVSPQQHFGSYRQRPEHTIAIRVNRNTQTYTIFYFTADLQVTSPESPVLYPVGSYAPSLRMVFLDGGPVRGRYTVDNVVISAACPLEDPGLWMSGPCDGG